MLIHLCIDLFMLYTVSVCVVTAYDTLSPSCQSVLSRVNFTKTIGMSRRFKSSELSHATRFSLNAYTNELSEFQLQCTSDNEELKGNGKVCEIKFIF